MSKTKPKIIYTVTNDLSYDQRMIRICTSLAKAGYQITLVGREKADSKPLDQAPFKQIRLKCYFNKGKIFYIEYNFRLIFLLLGEKFAALGPVDLDTLLASFLVGKLKSKPIIFDAHEYFSEVPEVVERPIVKSAWEFLASSIIPRLKYCYTVGNALAKELSERYGPSFMVFRNMPNKSLKTILRKKDKETRILLYQGALNQGRGLEQCLETMTLLPNKFVLHLAGEGDCSTVLRKQVEDLELEHRVKFLGYLKPEALKQTTPLAFLGLNLLENKGLSYYYSLANKCFDYVQAGLPSLNMDFPEYRALNQQFETSLLITDLHPENLAKTIIQLDQDFPLYQKLEDQCKLAAKEWNWELEEIKLIHFYQSILPIQ